ncbi:hypothetical protein E4U42_004817 [Claviceps africana]|uniref:U1-type domain-containing protein n=1 Tax=Claviceps africana TaxID=83212 RepID=A0A8K0J5N6_9HYPO|nr:hypothetical protein E4U42_004817 [Claviceps africana]
MTEYWKNSPNYWCKHCAVFVRDTKLERQNHEATARHQNAIKRSLRELHRAHNREERDKERARREIERLEGVMAGGAVPVPVPVPGGKASSRSGAEELREQREQLARMGVSVPSAFLGDMAMPGEWTVTKERVVDGDGGDRLAMGVRKRGAKGEGEGEEDDEQDAVRGLFKRPRRWGRDSKTLQDGGEEDAELDALLGHGVRLKGEEHCGDDGDGRGGVKVKEEDDGRGMAGDARDGLAKEEEGEGSVKREDEEEAGGDGDGDVDVDVKRESGADVSGIVGDVVGGVVPVVFKKRKPKGLRTR